MSSKSACMTRPPVDRRGYDGQQKGTIYHVHCAYKSLSYLDLEIWRFLCQHDATDYFTPSTCAWGNKQRQNHNGVA